MRGKIYKSWENKLEAFWDSGLTLIEYCRQNNLNNKTASYWKQRLQPKHKNKEQNTENEPQELDIFEVKIKDDMSKSIDSGVAINLGDLTITLAQGFNLPTLKKVLSLLEVK